MNKSHDYVGILLASILLASILLVSILLLNAAIFVAHNSIYHDSHPKTNFSNHSNTAFNQTTVINCSIAVWIESQSPSGKLIIWIYGSNNNVSNNNVNVNIPFCNPYIDNSMFMWRNNTTNKR